MERINITYHGDIFTTEEKQQVKAELGLHLRQAPSDATACCCLSRENEGYACNLKVHSAKGHFYLHRESRSLDTLMQYVYDSMERSFADWHRDPDHFAKSHPLQDIPCKGASHKNVSCPLKPVENK